MSVLFFLPWVLIDEPKRISRVRLHPYIRRKSPGPLHGISQEAIDAILGNYGNQYFGKSGRTTKHVTSATLVTWDDDVEGLEIEEGRINSRLEEARYLTFCALSARQYGSHFEYCNSDGYQIIGQRFAADSPGATAIRVRRRDGSGSHYLGSSSEPRFIRPAHVDSRLKFNVDEPLFEALLSIPTGDTKTKIDSAIDAYLLANSDSWSVRERAEIVLLRVAFETFLDSTHLASDLREKFSIHFSAEVPTPAVWRNGMNDEVRWRTRWPDFVSRPLDAWVQDFCAARNAAAHGPRGAKTSTVWSNHNHLLFGSWLFPLMVKKALEDEGLFHLNEEEKIERARCEDFLAHDLLSTVDDTTDELWWSKVQRELLFDSLWKKVFLSTSSS